MISLPGPRRLRKVFDEKVSTQAGLRKVFDDKPNRLGSGTTIMTASRRRRDSIP